MAMYERRMVRCRGRLVQVYARNGYPLTVKVIWGKPLDFGRFTAEVDSWSNSQTLDTLRVLKLFARSATVRDEST